MPALLSSLRCAEFALFTTSRSRAASLGAKERLEYPGRQPPQATDVDDDARIQRPTSDRRWLETREGDIQRVVVPGDHDDPCVIGAAPRAHRIAPEHRRGAWSAPHCEGAPLRWLFVTLRSRDDRTYVLVAGTMR